MKKNTIVCIIFILAGGAQIFCQSTTFVRYFKETDGLVNRHVYTMVEESPGRYWLGTKSGMQLFDGHHFWGLEDLIGHDPLAGIDVYDLQISNDNILYIKVLEKAFTLDLETYQFNELFPPDSEKGVFVDFFLDGADFYYVKLFEGYAKVYLSRGENLQVIDSVARPNQFTGYELKVTDKIIAWSSAELGLRILDKNDFSLLHSSFDIKVKYPFLNISKDEILLSYNDTEILSISPPYDDGFKLLKSLPQRKVSILSRLSDGTIWNLSEDFLSIAPSDQIIDRNKILSEFDIPIIINIFEDSQKNIWLSTVDGFAILFEKNPGIQAFFKNNNKGENHEFRSIFRHKDVIYAWQEGNHNELFTLDLKTKKSFKVKLKDEQGEPLGMVRNSTKVQYDSVRDKFWTFIYHLGIGLLDPKTMRFEQIIPNAEDRFVRLSSGQLLIGNRIASLQIYDPTTDSLRKWSQDKRLDEIVSYIHDVIEMSDGNILISSLKGLYFISPSGNLLKHLDQTSSPPLPHQEVIISYEDADGKIWGGTKGAGLFSLSADFKNIETFAKEDGLPNLIVPIVKPFGPHHMLAATFNGLSLIDKRDKTIYNYFKANGLSHNEFNTTSYFQDDSLLFLGTLNGINQIDTNILSTETQVNQLSVSRVSVYNAGHDSLTLYQSLNQLTDGIQLGVDDNWFQVDFGISDFIDPDRNIYKYKIDGYHTVWQTKLGEGSLRFEGLSAGRYTLRIRGANPSNEFAENEIFFPITKAQIFYKSNLFYLLSIGLLGGIAFYWIRRIRTENRRLEKAVEDRTSELQRDKLVIEQQKEQLSELDTLKNQFFANISHELRTPLTLMLSPLDKVGRDENLSSEQKGLIRLMKSNGQLLKERLDEMFELTRLSVGKVSLENSEHDLTELLDEVSTSFSSLAEDRHITFTTTQNNTEGIFLLDRKKLVKIIQNLINNAIKFTDSGGRVFCSFVYEDDHLKIEIKDTGQGIDKKEVEKIFERFYQSTAGSQQANPGTGIGLSMVKEYIELMEGEIYVESKLKEGTNISLSLPMQRVKQVVKNSKMTVDANLTLPRIVNAGVLKPSLLIVEDNSDLRRYIRSLLEDQFDIVEAEDGLVALDKLNSGSIDIILSDIMMPRMNGTLLLERVRSDVRFRIIPFLFLTAKHNDEDVLKAYKMGVDDYLKKPFEIDELFYRLKAVYDNYQMRVAYQDAEVPKTTLVEENYGNQDFIKVLENLIIENLSEHDFSIENIADKMDISSRHLLRVVKREIGMTVNQFIREIRLHQARKLSESGGIVDVKRLAKNVGFSSTKYFKKLYFDRFGVNL